MDTGPEYGAQLPAVEAIDASFVNGAFIASCAVAAADYLASHEWGKGFRRMLFGCAVTGTAAAFLVELDSPVGRHRDRWVWVVGGAGPSAYLVPDAVVEPADALLVYADLVDEWVSAVRGSGGVGETFPFRWGREEDDLNCLQRMTARIRSIVASIRGQEAPSPMWLDGTTCPKRTDRGGASDEPPASVDAMMGMLVRDHAGELGIVVASVPRPSPEWLMQQRDERFRSMQHRAWLKVLCVSGGSVAVPTALLTLLGSPGPDVVELALRNANEFGKRLLKSILRIN